MYPKSYLMRRWPPAHAPGLDYGVNATYGPDKDLVNARPVPHSCHDEGRTTVVSGHPKTQGMSCQPGQFEVSGNREVNS
jgi:hypothetical protein